MAIVYNRPAWTLMHRRWLHAGLFVRTTQRIPSCWKIAISGRRGRGDARSAGSILKPTSKPALPDMSLTPVVKALQALRGLALVAGKVTLVAELSATSPVSPIRGSSWPIWVSFLSEH